jgi:selenocysteine-specific elongation factor
VLAPTTLAGVPIIPVSSVTGEGVDELVNALDELLASVPDRRSHGRPRLAVDRTFSISGFGTVVTGTLLGDSLRVGQDVELLPSGTRTRIRGLQVHGEAVESAPPGERAAVNLTGVDREDVQRGDLLTVPGWVKPTRLLDARIRLVPDAPRALEQNDPVDFFVGASEASAHVTILAAKLLRPGEEGWVQLRFSEPVVAVERDLFIIRQASPSLTIGGGVVVNAHPRRHRRFREDVIQELETRATGTPLDRLVQLLSEGPRSVRDASSALELELDEMRELVREGATEGTLRVLGSADDEKVDPGRMLMHAGQFEQLSGRAIELVEQFHRQSPLRAGMPREELRSRLGLDARTYDVFIQSQLATGCLIDRGDALSAPGFTVTFTDDQQARIDRYIAALGASPNSPPPPSDFGLDGELVAAIAGLGLVVHLADNVVFSAEQLDRVRQETLAMIDERGSLTLAEFRDHFGSSRKYAQAVLEHFDARRITRRVGDKRVRGSG